MGYKGVLKTVNVGIYLQMFLSIATRMDSVLLPREPFRLSCLTKSGECRLQWVSFHDSGSSIMAAQICFILDQVVVRFSIIDYTFLYDSSLDPGILTSVYPWRWATKVKALLLLKIVYCEVISSGILQNAVLPLSIFLPPENNVRVVSRESRYKGTMQKRI